MPISMDGVMYYVYGGDFLSTDACGKKQGELHACTVYQTKDRIAKKPYRREAQRKYSGVGKVPLFSWIQVLCPELTCSRFRSK